MQGKNFLYFSSEKSRIVKEFIYYGKNYGFETPFQGATIETTTNSVSYVKTYTDIMVSHFNPGCLEQREEVKRIDA